jgi:rubrerythrin
MRRDPLAAVGVHGMTRSAFLVRGALGATVVSGLAAVQPFVAGALAKEEELVIVGGPGTRSDVEALQFLLTIEQLEAELYLRALAQLSLGAETRDLTAVIGENDADHARKLTAMIELLGGEPAKRPQFSFPLSDEASFLELAARIEDVGIGAYNGAARGIRSMPVLELLAGIAQVEGRHAGALKQTQGRPPTRAFSEALPAEEVLDETAEYMESSK